LATIRQPDAHTIGTACERQSLGRNPAGAAHMIATTQSRPTE
jgi:hypothetical protein